MFIILPELAYIARHDLNSTDCRHPLIGHLNLNFLDFPEVDIVAYRLYSQLQERRLVADVESVEEALASAESTVFNLKVKI